MELFSLLYIQEKVLLVAVGGFLFLQLLYYICIYNRINFRARNMRRDSHKHSATELPPLSVVIYAGDEPDNLRHNLLKILQQDYPQPFEVIVINNGNNDNNDYIAELKEKYPNLHQSFVPDSSRYISHKKLALTLGIRASKYDWIVLTNADCVPRTDQWLRLIAGNFTPGTEIVLGYGGYEYDRGWLNKCASYDSLFTAMRYMGYALAHSPYMGLGHNLAYRKAFFYKNKGFSGHLDLRGGDDDLFVNMTCNGSNTRVEVNPNATILRSTPVSATAWREEHIARMSTSGRYHSIQPWLNGMETFTRLLFYVSWLAAAVTAIVLHHWAAAAIAVSAFLLRFVIQAVTVNATARNLGEKRRYYWTLPVFDILHPLQSLQWRVSYLLRNKDEFRRK